jgi:hypothetical protein
VNTLYIFGHAEEKHFVPFDSHRSFLELKLYVNSLKPSEEQVVFEDEGFGEGFSPEDDSH